MWYTPANSDFVSIDFAVRTQSVICFFIIFFGRAFSITSMLMVAHRCRNISHITCSFVIVQLVKFLYSSVLGSLLTNHVILLCQSKAVISMT
jgi:hypothetical protein